MAHSSAPASLVSESQLPLGRFRREAIVGLTDFLRGATIGNRKGFESGKNGQPPQLVASHGQLPSRLTHCQRVALALAPPNAECARNQLSHP